MHIGVYGSGYLATVISACLADFGTPVCCCHADSSRITEVAKGDIPFFEKNLQEVIRRNVRSGRLVYSTDPEDLARKAQVIFLAEDSAQGLEQLVLRMARAAGRVQVLSIVTPVRVSSISTRPTGAFPSTRAPASSKWSRSPFSTSRTSGFGSRPRKTRSAIRACWESCRYSP